MAASWPRSLRASPRPTLVVVLPSPAGVGVMPATRISLPSVLPFSVSAYSGSIFALT
jgi:hypothetical protein